MSQCDLQGLSLLLTCLPGAAAGLPHASITAVDSSLPAHLLPLHGCGRLHGALPPPERRRR